MCVQIWRSTGYYIIGYRPCVCSKLSKLLVGDPKVHPPQLRVPADWWSLLCGLSLPHGPDVRLLGFNYLLQGGTSLSLSSFQIPELIRVRETIFQKSCLHVKCLPTRCLPCCPHWFSWSLFPVIYFILTCHHHHSTGDNLPHLQKPPLHLSRWIWMSHCLDNKPATVTWWIYTRMLWGIIEVSGHLLGFWNITSQQTHPS